MILDTLVVIVEYKSPQKKVQPQKSVRRHRGKGLLHESGTEALQTAWQVRFGL